MKKFSVLSKPVAKSFVRGSGTISGISRKKKLAPFFGKWCLTPFLVLWVIGSLSAAEPIMKTLSAHVVKVASDGASLDVDFHNPATQKIQRMTFSVDDQTGLSGIEKLGELRAGQVVNIDYVEGEKRRFFIRRIARVKLSGPPAGLENFRGL